MPWGMGGGPWWVYPEFRRYWWRCWRYPWLPKGWWASPEYFENITPKEEKKILKEELEALGEEMKAIEERLKELEKKK